jgi:DNA invertase Pin-like site-specific DNA recombinase
MPGTGTPAGKLVFGIFAALSEFERELISERTRAGLASARAAAAREEHPLVCTFLGLKVGTRLNMDSKGIHKFIHFAVT